MSFPFDEIENISSKLKSNKQFLNSHQNLLKQMEDKLQGNSNSESINLKLDEINVILS